MSTLVQKRDVVVLVPINGEAFMVWEDFDTVHKRFNAAAVHNDFVLLHDVPDGGVRAVRPTSIGRFRPSVRPYHLEDAEKPEGTS